MRMISSADFCARCCLMASVLDGEVGADEKRALAAGKVACAELDSCKGVTCRSLYFYLNY